eukprot:14404558-Ditylum_brightwellii.AAC.1
MQWKLGKSFFQVYYKKNQQLKYVDHLSTHMQSMFKSITKGVLTQLGRLTSRAKELDLVKIDSIYPDHAKALSIADVVLEILPTFGEIWKTEDEVLMNQERKQRRDRQATYFVLGYSNFIHDANIPKLIKTLWRCYNLKWIRISMSCTRCTVYMHYLISEGKINNKTYKVSPSSTTLGIKSITSANGPGHALPLS